MVTVLPVPAFLSANVNVVPLVPTLSPATTPLRVTVPLPAVVPS